MAKTGSNLADVAGRLLAAVDSVSTVKVAAVSAGPVSDIGSALRKYAAEVRATPVDVTYEDLEAYRKNHGL